MNAKETYKFWLGSAYFDEDTKKELAAIAGDENEIEERFYRNLEFGTGGLRGIIGAGTNRMNIYTVRKATQGLANFILKEKAEKRVLRLPMIQEICHRNLLRRQLCVLRQTESGHLFFRLFVPHRCFPLQSESLDVRQVL